MPQTEVRIYRAADGAIPLTDWLDDLEKREPKAFAKCLQRILELSRTGHEMRRPNADYLRDGIYELRAKKGRVNYRILYFFFGRHMACLSQGLTKENEVPDDQIETAIQQMAQVKSDPDRFTATWGTE